MVGSGALARQGSQLWSVGVLSIPASLLSSSRNPSFQDRMSSQGSWVGVTIDISQISTARRG